MSTKYVLVTGASTGIGKACALTFAAQGWHVFAGVRKPKDGVALVADGGPRIQPLQLDVTRPSDIDSAREQIAVITQGHGLHGLVNNAGIAVAGPVEFVPMEDLRRQIEINVFGQVMVTQAMLSMIREAQGRICFISSTNGFFSPPFMAPYAASKFAIEAIGDALRVELAPWNIRVSLVQPGAISTPIWEKSKAEADDMIARLPQAAHALYGVAVAKVKGMVDSTAQRAVPAEEVAKSVAHALTASRPRTRYRVGNDAFVEYLLARWIPDRLRDALVRKLLGL